MSRRVSYVKYVSTVTGGTWYVRGATVGQSCVFLLKIGLALEQSVSVDIRAPSSMSTLSNLDTTSSVTTDDYLKPVYNDGTPIKWDGNYATIIALLHEVQLFWKRKGLFQYYLKHHAVPMRDGLPSLLS